MSARGGGVPSGWLLNQEPVIGLAVVRTVGGPDITPSSADRTSHGLDESRSAGRGRNRLTWFGRQPAATKRFGALTFQNVSIRGGYAHEGW
jgi:hypothetical protein